jgi:hypothetical protein
VKQPVSQLPWGHVLPIMQRAKDPATRDSYIRQMDRAAMRINNSNLDQWPGPAVRAG